MDTPRNMILTLDFLESGLKSPTKVDLFMLNFRFIMISQLLRDEVVFSSCSRYISWARVGLGLGEIRPKRPINDPFQLRKRAESRITLLHPWNSMECEWVKDTKCPGPIPQFQWVEGKQNEFRVVKFGDSMIKTSRKSKREGGWKHRDRQTNRGRRDVCLQRQTDRWRDRQTEWHTHKHTEIGNQRLRYSNPWF